MSSECAALAASLSSESVCDDNAALTDVLRRCSAVKMTPELLLATPLPRLVNRLRRRGDDVNDSVKVMAGVLVREWKRILRGEGRVFVGSMNLRGAWAARPPGAVTVNVTSAQARRSEFRRDFSPMTVLDGGYKKYACFENYWQAGKAWSGVPLSVSKAWWAAQTKGRRRYPGGKGRTVLWAIHSAVDKTLGYIESRKKVYVPEYDALMRGTPSFRRLRQAVMNGSDVVIMDFDGPRAADGGVQCKELTLELLREKINDPSQPFGHGYVVAAALRGIPAARYTV